MGKTAFIFPGQGAQYPGMGKDFYESFQVSAQVYELALRVTGLNVAKLCFAENDLLNRTQYTQIAMVATQTAILAVMEEKGIRCDVCAGLSLGEYSALAVTRAIALSDLFHLIRMRGIFMEEACPVGGAMAAVLGADEETVKKVCEETPGIVSVANYNCPGQYVITGLEKPVAEACSTLLKQGAKKCVPLKVSGPFHSVLMEEAGKKLDRELEKVSITMPLVPYFSNVEAVPVQDKDRIRELLVRQVSSPVLWQQSMERMIEDGVDTFVEIGPGSTLTGFLRRINRQVTCLKVEKAEDVEKVAEVLRC